eukprot:gene15362-biopygen7082
MKDKGVDSVAKVCSVGMGVLLRDCAVSKVDARNIYDECCSILEGSPRSTSLGEKRHCAVSKVDARNIYDECCSILEGSPRSTSLGEKRQRLQLMKAESLSPVLRKLKLVHLERVLKDNGVKHLHAHGTEPGVRPVDAERPRAIPDFSGRFRTFPDFVPFGSPPEPGAIPDFFRTLPDSSGLLPDFPGLAVLRKLKLAHLERSLNDKGVDSVAKVCSVGMGVLLRDCAVSKVDARNIYDECCGILEGSPRSDGGSPRRGRPRMVEGSTTLGEQRQRLMKDESLSPVLRKLKLVHLELALNIASANHLI